MIYVFAVGALTLLLIYLLHRLVIKPQLLSPLRKLPSAPRTSFLLGNLPELVSQDVAVLNAKWMEQDTSNFGAVRFWSIFGRTDVLLTDPVGLKHILLTHSYDFPKPDGVARELSQIAGDGLLLAEGENHKRQRRVMNPSFAPSHLKGLVPIFFASAHKLKERWIAALNSEDGVDTEAFPATPAGEEKKSAFLQTRQKGTAILEVTSWFRKVTLDIIGLAGFGYDLSSLSEGENELRDSLHTLMKGELMSHGMVHVLLVVFCLVIITRFPFLERFVTLNHVREMKNAVRCLDESTGKIIEEKKKAVASAETEEDGGRDLISLLLKSIAPDAKSPLSDSELRGQIKTFILAGHETTSGSLAWLFLALARNQEAQEKLREEVTAALDDDLDMDGDQLNAIPYLDAVCRETLRVDPPVYSTLRRSPLHVNTTIPMSNNRVFEIPPSHNITVPISYMNRRKDIWGEDGDKFRPERWLEERKGMGEGLGIWSGLMTFLEGILELKAIVAVLICNFKFEEREPGLEILKKEPMIPRPSVKGEEKMGNRLPLKISLVKRKSGGE